MLWRKKADVNTDVTVCLESFLSRVGSKRGFFIAEKKEKKYNRLITNTLFCFLIRNKERNQKRKVSDDLRRRHCAGTRPRVCAEGGVAGGAGAVCGEV